MADETQKPHVTLHWLELSRSQRIVWLLEECKGLDYTIKTYKRGEDKLAGPELKAVHPLGKSPVITITAAALKEPLVIAESAAMTEYLCDHFAQHLVPARYPEGKEGVVGGEREEWMRYRFFMHYAEGSLMTMLILGIVVDGIKNAPVPFFIKPITRSIAGRVEDAYLNRNLTTHFDFLESQLASSPGGGKYLCGTQLTAADILMSFPLMAAKKREKFDTEKYPKMTAYVGVLEAEEVYQRSIMKAEEATGEEYVVV